MSVKLIQPVDETAYLAPQDKDVFFGEDGKQDLAKFEDREARLIGQPGKSCDVNLFLGLFFDGTANNYDTSSNAHDRSHSNVARLYGAYPGQSVPGIPAASEAEWTHETDNYKNFFRIYIPGVGTPFSMVDDSGTGADRTLGRATARYGERRIIWALLQTLNAVFRYCTNSKGVGLFDTVASVGIASSSLIADGHGAWADAENYDNFFNIHAPNVRAGFHRIGDLS